MVQFRQNIILGGWVKSLKYFALQTACQQTFSLVKFQPEGVNGITRKNEET